MFDIRGLHEDLARFQADAGISYRRVRYNGTLLRVNPRVNHQGLNSAYQQTQAIRDAVETWEVFLDKNILAQSNIPATALADFDFGKWQISEDGVTWINTFILDFPTQQAARWVVKLARGITGANLVVSYRVGNATFTTDPATGNPVEGSAAGTFYATVSQARGRTEFEASTGLSPGRVYLEGFYTDVNGVPVDMPTDLQLMRPWPAVLDVGNGQTVAGTFLVLIHAQNPDNRDEPRRGSTVQGWFATVGTGL